MKVWGPIGAAALALAAVAGTAAAQGGRRPQPSAKKPPMTAEERARRVAAVRNQAEAQRVAALVQARYAKTKRYAARFRQTTVITKHAVTKVQTGRLYFERPGKMSFRYDQPKGLLAASDGTEVRLYDPSIKTVYRTKWKRSLYPAALTFLEGKAVLPRDYHLRILDYARDKVDEGRVLEAVPKKPSPVVSRLLLHVDDRSGQVHRVLVMDAQGNHNRFELIEPVRNAWLPKKAFRFPSTRGKTVIRP